MQYLIQYYKSVKKKIIMEVNIKLGFN